MSEWIKNTRHFKPYFFKKIIQGFSKINLFSNNIPYWWYIIDGIYYETLWKSDEMFDYFDECSNINFIVQISDLYDVESFRNGDLYSNFILKMIENIKNVGFDEIQEELDIIQEDEDSLFFGRIKISVSDVEYLDTRMISKISFNIFKNGIFGTIAEIKVIYENFCRLQDLEIHRKGILFYTPTLEDIIKLEIYRLNEDPTDALGRIVYIMSKKEFFYGEIYDNIHNLLEEFLSSIQDFEVLFQSEFVSLKDTIYSVLFI